MAKKAIETFKDELMWYFREYKDYYIEDKKMFVKTIEIRTIDKTI